MVAGGLHWCRAAVASARSPTSAHARDRSIRQLIAHVLAGAERYYVAAAALLYVRERAAVRHASAQVAAKTPELLGCL